MKTTDVDLLPLVDVHTTTVSASCEQTWDSLLEGVRRGASNRAGSLFARTLGCEDWRPTEGELTDRSQVVGFRVAEMRAPHRLLLSGRHRFSRYTLTFDLESLDNSRCLLRATTHAAFPGYTGAAYQAAVIGSGAHRALMRRMIREIAKRAES